MYSKFIFSSWSLNHLYIHHTNTTAHSILYELPSHINFYIIFFSLFQFSHFTSFILAACQTTASCTHLYFPNIFSNFTFPMSILYPAGSIISPISLVIFHFFNLSLITFLCLPSSIPVLLHSHSPHFSLLVFFNVTSSLCFLH